MHSRQIDCLVLLVTDPWGWQSRFQNSDGDDTFPGSRQLLPTTAIGSDFSVGMAVVHWRALISVVENEMFDCQI
jgi:hypothetical protein